jgi:hypothetical protein
MPVFTCTSCGRLLHRPEEFVGRAWQCPTCGPTTVSEDAASVPAELAALLETEYQRGLSGPPSVYPGPASAVQVPLWGPLKRDDLTIGVIILVAVLVAWAIEVRVLPLVQSVVPDWPRLGRFALVIALGAFVGLVIFLAMRIKERHRRRWLKAIESHPSTTSSPGKFRWTSLPSAACDAGPHVVRNEDAGSKPAPKDTTHL